MQCAAKDAFTAVSEGSGVPETPVYFSAVTPAAPGVVRLGVSPALLDESRLACREQYHRLWYTDGAAARKADFGVRSMAEPRFWSPRSSHVETVTAQ
jgi:hypothetical protein